MYWKLCNIKGNIIVLIVINDTLKVNMLIYWVNLVWFYGFLIFVLYMIWENYKCVLICVLYYIYILIVFE